MRGISWPGALGSLRRSARVLRVQTRAAVLLSLQYRVEFAVDTAMAFAWTAAALAPLAILFRMRDGVAGWSWPEALVVVGFFTILKGLLVGVIQPALNNVVEHVRKGTLDFLLLKPVDAQLLLSTSKLDLPRVADLFSGSALVAYGVARVEAQRALGLIGSDQ